MTSFRHGRAPWSILGMFLFVGACDRSSDEAELAPQRAIQTGLPASEWKAKYDDIVNREPSPEYLEPKVSQDLLAIDSEIEAAANAAEPELVPIDPNAPPSEPSTKKTTINRPAPTGPMVGQPSTTEEDGGSSSPEGEDAAKSLDEPNDDSPEGGPAKRAVGPGQRPPRGQGQDVDAWDTPGTEDVDAWHEKRK